MANVKNHSSVSCPIVGCGKIFNYYENLTTHIRTNHRHYLKATETRCIDCGLNFNSYDQLRRHYNLSVPSGASANQKLSKTDEETCVPAADLEKGHFSTHFSNDCSTRAPLLACHFFLLNSLLAQTSQTTINNWQLNEDDSIEPLVQIHPVRKSDTHKKRGALDRLFDTNRANILADFAALYGEHSNSYAECVRAIHISQKLTDLIVSRCTEVVIRCLEDSETLNANAESKAAVTDLIATIETQLTATDIIDPLCSIDSVSKFRNFLQHFSSHGSSMFVPFIPDETTVMWTGNHLEGGITEPEDPTRCGFHYVPIGDTLRRLLKINPELIDCLEKPPKTQPKTLTKTIHGRASMENKLLNDDQRITIGIGLAIDDVPLSDKGQESQTVINGFITNLPSYQSTAVDNLWTVGQASAKHIKATYQSTDGRLMRGLDLAMRHISKEILELEESGFEMDRLDSDGNLERIRVFVTLVVVTGDKKGLHELYHLVEGFTSTHPCSMCNISKQFMETQFDPKFFNLRTKEQLLEQQETAEKLFAAYVSSYCSENQQFDSKLLEAYTDHVRVTGVRGICHLRTSHWDVVNNPIIDIMHDADTGMFQYAFTSILKLAHSTNKYNAEKLVKRMKLFKPGQTDASNRFRTINRKCHLPSGAQTTGLKAAQSYSLIRLIDQVITEDELSRDSMEWNLLIQLRAIMLALHSPRMTTSEAKLLIKYIGQFYTNMAKKRFFAVTKPKLHYLLHLHLCLLRGGPLMFLTAYSNESCIDSGLIVQAVKWNKYGTNNDCYRISGMPRVPKADFIASLPVEWQESLYGKNFARKFELRGSEYSSGGIIVHRMKMSHPQTVYPVEVVGLVFDVDCNAEGTFVLVRQLSQHAKCTHIHSTFVVDMRSSNYASIDLRQSALYHQLDGYPHSDTEEYLKRIYLHSDSSWLTET